MKQLFGVIVLSLAGLAHSQEVHNAAHFALLNKCRDALEVDRQSADAARICLASEAAVAKTAPFSYTRLVLVLLLASAAENNNPALAHPGAKAYQLKVAELSPTVNKNDPDRVVEDLIGVAKYFDHAGDWATALTYFEGDWKLALQSKTQAVSLEKRVLDEVDASFYPRRENPTPAYVLADDILWKQRRYAHAQAHSGADEGPIAQEALALGKLYIEAKDKPNATQVTQHALTIYRTRGDKTRTDWAQQQLKEIADL